MMKDNSANLDILRSFAVLSVFSSHVWQHSVPFGYWTVSNTFANAAFALGTTGVAFFFVHTFLVLMLSLSRSPAQHKVSSFYVRRAFRIYPLCWVAIVIALSTHLTDFQFGSVSSLPPKWVIANFLLVHDVVHGPFSYGVLGPLWSLPWEIQMYLILPFLFFIVDRWKNPLVSIIIWFATTCLAVACTALNVRHAHWLVFPPMFFGGMIAYQLIAYRDKLPHRRSLPSWIWPIWVLILFAVPVSLLGGYDMETWQAASVDGCICMLMGISVAFFPDIQARGIVRPAHQIAKYSYGIYLLHVPVIFLIYRYLPHVWHPLRIALVILLTGAVSVGAFHMIENPLIQFGKRITRQRQQLSKPELPGAPSFARESCAKDESPSRESSLLELK
ncbi:MAG TPA: acyltransferase [Terracidiphilus sp.]|jgi:peptidoglycan/LPS O-acetylase OafA/YrhL|nr:acyltransferase [Terracidiphilus sp.]